MNKIEKHQHKDVVVTRNSNGELVVTSRQVAEDFGKQHQHVTQAIENLISENSLLKSMMMESEYTTERGRKYKEYLLTRDGFSLLVMGFTGAKALKWKLKYIEAFNKMEEALRQPQKQLSPMEMLELQFQVIKEQEEKLNEVDCKIEDLKENMPLFNVDCKEIQAAVRKKGIETLGGKASSAYKNNSLRGKVYSDIQKQLKREFGVGKYEAIKRRQLEKAKEIISLYRAPLVLEQEITITNDQIKFED